MNLSDIPFDDPKAFELLGRGETLGIFQVESPGMQGLLRSVRPTSLNDISAVLALYRPGPLDNGYHTEYARRKHSGATRAEIHPELDDLLTDILSETYGLMVYQEQVMEMISRVTGWSYAEADDILSAMRKKKLDKMESAKPAFWLYGQQTGFSDSALSALWETLIPFSDYSFNKSHSIGYAYLTYRGAYLKAHYPHQYLSALLTRAPDLNETAKYIAEARRMNIQMLPPDVNFSGPDFSPESDGIRYGLASIKGVGYAAAESISNQRPYDDVDGFFRKSDAKVLNARVLEALIKSGALDSLWGSREELLQEAPELARVALSHRKEAERGQPTAVRARYYPRGRQPLRPTDSRGGDPGFSGGASSDTKRDDEGAAGRPSGQEAAIQAQRETEKGSRRQAPEWEREFLGAEFTVGRIVLKLGRALTPTEWQWVGQLLTNRSARQPVVVRYSNSTFNVPYKSTYGVDLGRYLAGLEIKVEES